MQKINDRIQDVLKQHKTKKQYLFVLFLLSAMVIAAVCFSLMTPAVSMSGQLVCGEESHVHGDDCYGELICAENTEGHTHSDECYTTGTTLICGSENDKNHEHTDDCYDKELTCGLEETTAHEHTQSCYALTCVKKVHEHSQACFSGDAGIAIVAETQFADEETQEEDNLIMAAPAGIMANDYQINDERHNFYNDITKFDLGDPALAGDKYGAITQLGEDVVRSARLNINYHLDKLENKVIFCDIPPNVIANKDGHGPLRDTFIYNGVEKPIGTYDINKDGKGEIVITFDDDFVAEYLGKPVDGYVFFNGYVKESKNDGRDEIVGFNGLNIDVPFADINVNKSVESKDNYTIDNPNVKYTVTIDGGLAGTGEGYITVEDTIRDTAGKGDTISINQDSFVIYEQEGDETETRQSVTGWTKTIDGLTYKIEGLPELTRNKKYIIEYSVGIEPSASNTEKIKTENTVTVTNGNLPPKEKNASYEKELNMSLTKTGSYDPYTKKVTWTITVNNPLGKPLDGYTLEDTMFNNTLNISNKNFSDVGSLNNNTFTFGNNAKEQSYTFQFTTDVTDDIKEAIKNSDNKLTNKATLTKDTTVLTDSAKVEIKEAETKIEKKPGNAVNKGKDIIEIPWTVELTYGAEYFNDGILVDAIIDDNDNHYMTQDQIDKIEVKNGWDFPLVEEGYGWPGNEDKEKLYTIVPTYSSDNKYTGFTIEFNIEKDTQHLFERLPIRIYYSTTGNVSGMQAGDKRAFENNVSFQGESDPKSYTYKKNDPFFKWDTNDFDKPETQYDLQYKDQLNKIKQGDEYRLKWSIVANEQGDYDANTDVTFTDILPENVQFGSATLKVTEGTNNSLSDYNNSGNKFQVIPNGQNVTFVIPKDVHNGKKFQIDYYVTLSTETLSNDSTTESKPFEFENSVSKGSITKTQKQTIIVPPTPPESNNGKTGSNPMEMLNNDKTGKIDYSFEVSGIESTDGSGQIYVYDRMLFDAGFSQNTISEIAQYIIYEPVNIKVYKQDGSELEKSKWSVQYDPKYQHVNQYNEKAPYATPLLTFILPEKIPLRITYTYNCSYSGFIKGEDPFILNLPWDTAKVGEFENNDTEYVASTEVKDSGVKITNRVYFNQRDKSDADLSHTGRYYLYKTDGGGAVSPSSIEKVDSKNYAIKLNGAKFALWKYKPDSDDPNDPWEIINSNLVTAHSNTYGDGMVILPGLTKNTLYRIKETEAPENYVASDEYYYFVYDCNKGDITIKPSNFDLLNVQQLKENEDLIIENTKVIVLPATGSVGSEPIIFIGISIMTSSAIIYFLSKGRKRRTKR